MSRDSELDQNLTGDFQKKFSSDLDEIWYVGRGRWLMHDGMPYGRNQGQGHSREVDRQSPTGLILIYICLSLLVALKVLAYTQIIWLISDQWALSWNCYGLGETIGINTVNPWQDQGIKILSRGQDMSQHFPSMVLNVLWFLDWHAYGWL